MSECKEVSQWFVVVHREAGPSDEDWQKIKTAYKTKDNLRGVIVYTREHGPSLKQRQELTQIWAAKPNTVRIAMITETKQVDGIGQAMDWITGSAQHKSFKMNQLNEAFDYVGAQGADAESLFRTLSALILRTAVKV